MCDCAEELERRERAKAEELENALAALRAQSEQPSFFKRFFGFLGFGSSQGLPGDGGSKWTFIGGAALLIGLLGFLYKNFGDKLVHFKTFVGSKKGKSDPCDGLAQAGKPKSPPPKPVTPCQCN